MVESSQPLGYTVDEIRVKFPHGLPDWDSADDRPFLDEQITWAEYYEAFPRPKQGETWELLSPTLLFDEQERQRTAQSWTTDPFTPVLLPFAAYLEPDGYAALHTMTSPVLKSYRRLVPRTYALASALYDSLPQRAIWGQQERARGAKAPWRTSTAGKWIDAKRKDGTKYRFPEQAMSLLDILKMLAHPDGDALANKDIPFGANTLVHHVRIDIDLDWTFREDYDDHLPDLAEEIRLVRRVYAAFGLTASVFRTGNRGIQAVAPIPLTDRREASVLTECVRDVLACTSLHPSRATDFQTSLEGLMRLPLGRHGLTDSFALFLGDDGLILPPDQQVASVLAAFCAVPDLDMAWAEEARPWLARTLPADRAIKPHQLRHVVSNMPENTLVKTFLSACREFDVRDWDEVCTHTTLGSLEKSGGDDSKRPPEPCTHITLDVINDIKDSQEKAAKRAAIWKSPRRLKEIGQAILDEGFERGESFHYYMNTNGGRNAIGWALVVHDGNEGVAEDALVAQARKVGGAPEALNDRISLIKRLIPKNDTYKRFQSRAQMFKHRGLDGDLLEAETLLAEAFKAALVEKRQTSSQRVKAFQPKSLDAIGHVVELAQLAARSSEDGLVRISTGTLAAQITHRWPECKIGKSAVVKLLEWITSGCDNCLMAALEVVYKPKRVTEPTIYELGCGIWDLVPVEIE